MNKNKLLIIIMGIAVIFLALLMHDVLTTSSFARRVWVGMGYCRGRIEAQEEIDGLWDQIHELQQSPDYIPALQDVVYCTNQPIIYNIKGIDGFLNYIASKYPNQDHTMDYGLCRSRNNAVIEFIDNTIKDYKTIDGIGDKQK